MVEKIWLFSDMSIDCRAVNLRRLFFLAKPLFKQRYRAGKVISLSAV